LARHNTIIGKRIKNILLSLIMDRLIP